MRKFIDSLSRSSRNFCGMGCWPLRTFVWLEPCYMSKNWIFQSGRGFWRMVYRQNLALFPGEIGWKSKVTIGQSLFFQICDSVPGVMWRAVGFGVTVGIFSSELSIWVWRGEENRVTVGQNGVMVGSFSSAFPQFLLDAPSIHLEFRGPKEEAKRYHWGTKEVSPGKITMSWASKNCRWRG